jgi:hypothetical protein
MFLLVMVGMVRSTTMSLFPELERREDKVLRFTTRILGLEAAQRLRKQAITQTIRSDKEIESLSSGDEVSVTLDGHPVGKARLVSIDRVKLSKLDKDDAIKGGFSTVEELRNALRRAGFRFLPLERYVENRVQFVWLSPISLPQSKVLPKRHPF